MPPQKRSKKNTPTETDQEEHHHDEGNEIADSVLDLSPLRVAAAGAIAISGKGIKEDLATWRRCRH
jgi:hypothetical protein